jgi:predicted DCC family thiol-disulfide oxidoreductase YuxK
MPAPPPAGRWLVLYDAECGLCKWLLATFLRWDRAERLRPMALQSSAAVELLGELDADERLASWHLISPGGERRSGGAAIPALVRLLPGGSSIAAPFDRFPGITERGYHWVAANRSRLSRPVPARSKRKASELVRRREENT